MQPHDLTAGGGVLDRVTRCAQQATTRYGCHPAATVRLLNVSENATYLVDDPDQEPSILRVHRLGYHTGLEIESELAWMDALRAEAGVRTPRVLAAADGRRVVRITDPASGEQRECVHFEYLPGREPVRRDTGHFADLGEITARMHRHARQWARSARLTAFGTGQDRYGLVHADTRLANLLVDDGAVSVIDFDDSGFSWFLYDVGTSVSFFEHEPQVPALIDSWLSGYGRAARLPAADEAEI